MGGEPTFESLAKPTPKKIWSRWNLKEIEEWLLLSSRFVGICSYCKSHQHLVAKIVNISYRDVWVVSHRNVWVGTYFLIAWLTRTEADMLGVALERDRGVVTAIFHVCSGLLILHVSSTPRCLDSQEFPIEMYGREPTFESLAKPTPKQICSGWH